MPGDLAARLRMIVHAPEVISIWHRRECAVEWKNFQTVTREIEFANDLGTEKGNYIRADRKLEAGKDFFRYSGAAKHVTTFEHEHFFARARQISGVDQTIVAAANHDDVVTIVHLVIVIAAC